MKKNKKILISTLTISALITTGLSVGLPFSFLTNKEENTIIINTNNKKLEINEEEVDFLEDMALSREQKEQSVADLLSTIKNSKSIIVWEYHGLDAETIGHFRSAVREVNGLNKVYKNRLAKIAFSSLGKEEILDVLIGPNSFLFVNENDEGSMKLLAVMIKKYSDFVSFKGGYIDGEWFSAEAVKEIASLPGKNDLLSMLLSVLQAPMRNMAYSLSLVSEQKFQLTKETKEES